MLATLLIPVLTLASTGLAYPTHSAIAKRATSLDAPVSQFNNEGYCLVDNVGGKRLLKEYITDDAMTLELCAAKCLELNRGYDLAGVEYGAECYCDVAREVQAKGFSISDDCTTPCPGKPSTFCGGSNAISAVTIELFGPPPSRPYQEIYCPPGGCVTPPAAIVPDALAPISDLPDGFATDGKCIKEIPGRLLKGPSYSASDNTYEKCSAFCFSKGFTVAGVEYSSECYCGSVLQSDLPLSTECNMPCSGDKTKICGGPDSLVIFTTSKAVHPSTGGGSIEPPTPPPTGPTTPAQQTPLGSSAPGWSVTPFCLRDGRDGKRLLSDRKDFNTAADGLTWAKCAVHCQGLNKGYDLAGVEYGVECYCGIANEIIARGYSLSNDCNVPCLGDRSQTCGGGNALTALVFGERNYGAPETSPPYNPDAIICPKDVGCKVDPVLQDKYTSAPVKGRLDWNYSGYCVRDNINGRVFKDVKVIPNVTHKLAIEYCTGIEGKNYDVAGIEYGNEVWCSSSSLFTNFNDFRLTTKCDFPCPGDPTQRCGGYDAITALTGPKVILPPQTPQPPAFPYYD